MKSNIKFGFFNSILKKLLFINCFFIATVSYAQKAGFKATIGYLTYTVKNGDVLNVCKDGSITYTSTAANYSNLSWEYDDGTVRTTSATTFSVTYNTVGSNFYTEQTVTLGGNDDKIKVKVIVSAKDQNLNAVIDYNPKTTQCGSSNIIFDASKSTGNGLTYYWDFGDGTTASTKISTHSFNTAIGQGGTQNFSVKLATTNADGCIDRDTQQVTVFRIPDAALINDPSNAEFTYFNGVPTFRKCEKLPSYKFIFVNNSSTLSVNTQYKFTWGDGSGTRTLLPSWKLGDTVMHTYNYGNTVLTLEVTGPNGCVAKQDYNVFIGLNAQGTISLSSVTGNSGCIGDTLEFPIYGIADNPIGTVYSVYVNDGFPFPNPVAVYQTTPPPVIYKYAFNESSCGKTYEGNINSSYIKVSIENACSSFPAGNSAYPIYISDTPKASIYCDTTSCVNSTVTINDFSNYGGVVNPADKSCSSGGLRVWTIKPTTGYSVSPANALGSLNGSVTNWNNWTSGASSFSINFTKAGDYFITLYTSNKNGCGKLDSVTQKICIQDKPIPKFNITATDADECFSDTITLANATAQGVCINNNYTWSVTNDSSACSSGNDYQFVSGTNNNTASPEIWFKQPGFYKISLEASASSSCKNVLEKTFVVKGKPLLNINPITDICAGNTINPSATITDCFGGGVSNINWSFPNGSPSSSTQQNPNNIFYANTGTQTISLNAQNSCGTSTATQTFQVTNKPPADAGPDKDFCDGQSVTIGINKGNFTYSWTPVTGLSNQFSPTPTVTLNYTGTSADTVVYSVKVSQGSNCDSTDKVKVIVKQPPMVNVKPLNTQLCTGGGNVTLTASGANTYSWSPSTFLNQTTGSTVTAINPTSTINYTVTGQLANGCSNTANASVTVNPAAFADAGPDNSICNGSSLQIGNNTGSFNYTWSPATFLNNAFLPNPTFLPIGFTSDTNVKLYVTADAGANCKALDSVTILVKKSPPLSINPLKPVVCIGDSVKVSASGSDNNDYTWQPANDISSTTGSNVKFFPPATSNYSVTAKNINGCSNQLDFTVTVNPNAIAAFIPLSYTNCAKYNIDTVIIPENHATENSNYSWYLKDKNGNTTQQNFANAKAPSFLLQNPGDSVEVYLTTTSKYGCKDSTTPTAIFKAGNDIKALFSKSSNGGCEPQQIKFTNLSSILDNSVNFTWKFGNGNFSNAVQPPDQTYTSGYFSNDTAYYISLNAAIACGSSTYTDTVKIKARPIARFGTDDNTSGCSPYSIKFKNTSAGSPLIYKWFFGDGDSLITSRDTAVAHQYITNSLDTFTVKLFAFDDCGVDSLQLPIVVAPNTISPQVSTYGNDLYGCVPPVYTVNFVNNTTGAFTSLWNFGDGQGANQAGNIVNVPHSYTAPGTYLVTVDFGNGCSLARDTQTVVIYAAAEAAFKVIDSTSNIFCLGDSIHLNISKQTGDYNYLYWGDANGSFYSPPVTNHYYKNIGTYTITLIADRVNSIGKVCSDTAYEIVRIAAKPDVFIKSKDTVDCISGGSQLYASGGVAYKWYPPNNLSATTIYNPFASPLQNTLYYVNITGSSGCVVKDSVLVITDFSRGSSKDFVPTAFTPNGDGINDCVHVLKAGINGQNIDKLDFRIYNRNGQLVFQTDNMYDCWDGKFNNSEQPAGTYVYQLFLKSACTNGNDIYNKGAIVLIR